MTAAITTPAQLADPRARCRGLDSSHFFPDDHEPWAKAKPRLEHAARTRCQPCPLLRECRAWAETAREVGMWGGQVRDRAGQKDGIDLLAAGTTSPPKKVTPRVLVDAAPVRAHILRLLEQGMTRRDIARTAGVWDSIVCAIAGSERRKNPPSKRTPEHIAAAILAVVPAGVVSDV